MTPLVPIEITLCSKKCGKSVGTRQNWGLLRERKRPQLPRNSADLKQCATATDGGDTGTLFETTLVRKPRNYADLGGNPGQDTYGEKNQSQSARSGQ